MIPERAFAELVSQGYLLLNSFGPYAFTIKHVDGRDVYVVLKYTEGHFIII